MVCDNPQEFLKSHIIKGDSSDGIPNILSDGDTFVNPEKRQKRLTKNVMNRIEQSLAEGSIPDDISEIASGGRLRDCVDRQVAPELGSHGFRSLGDPAWAGELLQSRPLHERRKGK